MRLVPLPERQSLPLRVLPLGSSYLSLWCTGPETNVTFASMLDGSSDVFFKSGYNTAQFLNYGGTNVQVFTGDAQL